MLLLSLVISAKQGVSRVFSSTSTASRSGFALLTAALFLCTPAFAALRILPLGDSITRGEGAGGSLVPGGYRSFLAQSLTDEAKSFRFVGDNSDNPTAFLTTSNQAEHSGHGGWRIDQIQSNITNWQQSFRPHAVLLHIGTNDILQGSNLGTGGVDTSAAVSRLTNLLNTLYSNNASLTVVLSTLIPIQDGRDGYIKNYNAFLSSTVVPHFLGQGRSIILVDNYSNFVTGPGTYRSERFADGVHPNAAGYQAMANSWLAAVATIPVPPDDPPPPPPPATLLSTSETNPGMASFDDRIRPNLIRNNQSTLGGVSASHEPSLPATFKTTGLNDGSAASLSNLTYYAVNEPVGNLPTSITFTLTGSLAGYDITSIESIAGWQDSNIGAQKFQLMLSIAGGEFLDYGVYAATASSGNFSSVVTITDQKGIIASGVTAIRFLYLNPGVPQAGNGGTVIRELQAFGTPTETTLRSTSEVSAGQGSFDNRIRENLIRANRTTLGGISVSHEPSLPATFKTAGLNDGSASTAANLTYYGVNSTSGGNLPTSITFALGGSETGYNITSIESIAGWQDSNIGSQRFHLQFSIGGGDFVNYGTHSATSTLGNFSSLITITDESGIIASGVTAIRFVYLDPLSTQGGDRGTVIREIQVFGTPTEPDTGGENNSQSPKVKAFNFMPGSAATATLTIQAAIPGTYVFQRSIDLLHWQNLESRVISQENDGISDFIDAAPPQGRAFYRITKE